MIRSKGTSCLLLPDSRMLKICKTINNRKYYEKYDDGDDDDDEVGISENSILIGSQKNIVRTLAMVHCNNNVDDYNVSNNNEKETIDTDLVEKNNNNDSNGGVGGGNRDKDNNRNIDENDGNNAVSQKTNNTDESTTLDDTVCSLVEVTNKNSSIYENYKEKKDVEVEEDVHVTRENVLEKEQEIVGNYVHMGFKSKYDTETGKKENGIFVDSNIDDYNDNIEEDPQYISMNVGKLYKLLKYNNSSDFEDYLDEPNNISLLKKPYRGSYNNNYSNNGGSGGGGKIKTKNMYSFNTSLNKKTKEFGCEVPSTKYSRSILNMKNNNSTFKPYRLESTETNSSSTTTTTTAGYDSPRKQSTFKPYVDSPNSTYSTLSNQSWYDGKREESEIVKEHRSKLLKSENSNNYADYVHVNDIIVDGNDSIIIKQKKSDENKQQRAADKEEAEEEEKQRPTSIGALNACLKKMEYVKKRKQEENLKFEEKRRRAIENNFDKCCIDTLCTLNELSRKIDYVVRRIEFQNKKLNVIYSYVERQNEIYYRNKVVPQQFEETGGEKDIIVDTQTVTIRSYSEIMKKVSIYDRMKKCFCCLK